MRYIGKKLITMLVTVLIVTLLVFFAFRKRPRLHQRDEMVLPLPVEIPTGIVYRPKQVVFHLPDAVQPLLRPVQFQEDFLYDVFGICPASHP